MLHDHRRSAILPLILLIGLASCGGDDHPSRPAPFAVKITVIDSLGNAVSGLSLDALPDTPYYQDGAPQPAPPPMPPSELRAPYPNPFYPTVRMDFVLTDTSHVILTVADVAGAEYRPVVDDTLPGGSFATIWPGRDANDDPAPSGIYYAHLVVRDPASDTVELDQRQPMLLARFGNDDDRVGITDAHGTVVLDDERLFPYLYDVPPFDALDEAANPVGLVTLTPTMRFYLFAADGSHHMRFDRDVTGSANFTFVWDR